MSPDGKVPSRDELLSRLLYRFADEAFVRKVQRGHVESFVRAGCRRVLDLGCGRGLFLEMLRSAGIEAVGVDGSAEVVEAVRRAGFEVHHGDALAFLRAQADAGVTYDGVFCSHLIEHLPGELAVELIRSIALVLRAPGRAVIVTPNIANPEVASLQFWLDVTHVRPCPRLLIEAMFSEVGMQIARSYDDPITARPYLRVFAEARNIPRDLARFGLRMFSGMDAVVIADRR
jgi:SAM-dependent methyltransferase